MAIPFHQTWKNHNLPQKFKDFQELWFNVLGYKACWDGGDRKQTTTPGGIDYDYKFYDDKALRDAVLRYTPQFIKAYDSFSENIERVDFARYSILFGEGGVYADMDTKPLKPIDEWVIKSNDENKMILNQEPKEHIQRLYGNRKLFLCNAFMISPSPPTKESQTFWMEFMKYIIKHYELNYDAVSNTGPLAMTKFYEENTKPTFISQNSSLEHVLHHNVYIADACIFNPIDAETGQATKGCNMEEDSYVVHVWENTHVPKKWTDSKLLWNKRYWTYVLLTLFIVIFVMIILFKKR
jgi:hypothetical protein